MYPARKQTGFAWQMPNGFRFNPYRMPFFNPTQMFQHGNHQGMQEFHHGSHRLLQNPRYDSGIRKRPASNEDFLPRKRPRINVSQPVTTEASSSSSMSTSFISPGSEPSNKFVVPVSHGTEKITISIWNYFLSSEMSKEDLQKKLILRKSLLKVMDGAFPNCRLFIVGSSMTGFATKSSDADMCLMITDTDVDQKRDATPILSSIAKALRHCTFIQKAQVIRAKVPILKFHDQLSDVECDLNINNLIGVRNTHLLRHYAYMDWRVRPLMLFIKHWARFHDINDASKKTISSYSLSLMLIHYLQAGIKPPVLPCLQSLRPDLFNPKTDVRKLSLNMEKAAVNFKSQNMATLGELFLGFLNYYTNVFNYDLDAISVRLGRRITRHEVVRSSDNPMQWKNLCIEEPFEKSNTARSVYDQNVFWRVLRVFNTSFNILERSRDVGQIFCRPF